MPSCHHHQPSPAAGLLTLVLALAAAGHGHALTVQGVGLKFGTCNTWGGKCNMKADVTGIVGTATMYCVALPRGSAAPANNAAAFLAYGNATSVTITQDAGSVDCGELNTTAAFYDFFLWVTDGSSDVLQTSSVQNWGRHCEQTFLPCTSTYSTNHQVWECETEAVVPATVTKDGNGKACKVGDVTCLAPGSEGGEDDHVVAHADNYTGCGCVAEWSACAVNAAGNTCEKTYTITNMGASPGALCENKTNGTVESCPVTVESNCTDPITTAAPTGGGDDDDKPADNTGMIIGIIIGVVLCCLIMVILVLWKKKKEKKEKQGNKNTNVVPAGESA